MPLFKVWSEDKLNKKYVVAEKFAELVSTAAFTCWRVADLTLFEALTGGAFDRLNWQHRGEFDQKFSKKGQIPRGLPGRGGMGGFGVSRHIIQSTHILQPLFFKAFKRVIY